MRSSPVDHALSPGLLARGLVRAPQRELLLGLLVFEVAFFLAYRYGMEFSQTLASPFWLPDSILLCALLRTQPKHWWIFVLAPLPIRLFTASAQEMPLWFLLGCFAVDSVKGLAAAFLLRRVIPNPIRLQAPGDLAWFGLIAVFAAPAISAFFGAWLRAALNGSPYWASWQHWFLGDAVAQLIATPAILYWAFRPLPKIGDIPPRRLAEAAALVIGLVAANYLAFDTRVGTLDFAASRLFLPIPFLFWAAIRFGMGGASAAVPVMAFFAVQAAIDRRGVFAPYTPGDIGLALQDFLILRAIPAYLVGALIEQRDATKRALRESEARFRMMANATPVFLWMTDRDKQCEFVNESWLAFTGRRLEQELGQGWVEGVHPDDIAACFRIYFDAFDARKPFELEYRLRRHDGTWRWVFGAGVPHYDADGTFLGYIGSAIDISDRKHAEELGQALAPIHRLALMGELTAQIAHEVRQPLAAILANAGAARHLLAGPTPPLDQLREIIREIEKDDTRANDVLTRIRDFLRKREPVREALDVNGIVREVYRFVSSDALRRHVDIAMDFGLDLPPVHGDRTQLQQVLLNLIINGMDAMEDIPPAERRMTLRTRQKDGAVEIAVIDHGSGIERERLPRLFDAFFTTKGEGMGLGLSIAESIVSAHRGRIWAENNPVRGATFRFTVPARAA